MGLGLRVRVGVRVVEEGLAAPVDPVTPLQRALPHLVRVIGSKGLGLRVRVRVGVEVGVEVGVGVRVGVRVTVRPTPRSW